MKGILHRAAQIYAQSLDSDILSETLQHALLGMIVLVILIVRLLTITAPALDRTHWKEIDYLMISTNYWRHGFNFLRPEVSWPAEPPRVTGMEFPLVPFSAALIYRIFGFNVYTARLITLLAFLLLTVYVFKLTKRELGPLIGLTAAFAAGVMPLYHVFGRFLFTEPLMIAMSVVTLYYTAEWVDRRRQRDWVLTAVSLSLTIALKIEALYLLLPIAWLAYREYRWDFEPYRSLAALVLCAMILPALWYAHAYYLEITGAHAFSIFKGHNKFQTLTMITSLHWYRTMVYRIGSGILGGKIGTLLVIPGLIVGLWERRARPFLVYLLTIGVYFVLVAEGQVDAPYRQLTSVPPLSVFMALGSLAALAAVLAFFETTVLSPGHGSWKQAIMFAGAVALISTIPVMRREAIGWWGGKSTYAHPVRWRVAREIKKHVDPAGKLVVAGEYSVHVGGNDLSPVLYHYTGLQGWTLQPEDWQLEYVKNLVGKGATHFVALRVFDIPEDGALLGEEAGSAFISELKERYHVLAESGNWVIMDLRLPAH